MLISVKTLTKCYGIKPTSVAHVGAHHAEEFLQYKQQGWGDVIWFEAIEENLPIINSVIENSNDSLVHAAIWNRSGESLEFHIASNSQATSVLEFNEHARLYPDIKMVETRRMVSTSLDDYFKSKPIPEFINIDIQGAELEALRGFSDSLHHVKWIYTEVNKQELYAECALVEEIDTFLKQYGLIRRKTRWVLNHGWGDALYVRETLQSKGIKVFFYQTVDSVSWIASQFVYRSKLYIRKLIKI
jgi:FkbM family methyltransferase